MIKNYYNILLLALVFSGVALAQSAQKNFINYQGVARNAENQLMANESMTISIALKFGASNAATAYEEKHTVTTDANGVFSLKIGNGAPMAGDYNTLNWGQEAVYLSTSLNGKIIGTTEMMAVPYAISSGDADDQSATEVPYNNAASGLTAINTQEAIDELVGSGAVDADADPTNEIQTISFDATTNELSLTEGGVVTIPSGGTDADADPTNEIQTISFDVATNEISLTDGGTITIPSGGTDADADPENEFQTLNFDTATNELSLTDGNTVTIPSGGTDADADPTNEIQTISFDVATNEISLTDGGTITIPSGGTDADADPTNEIDVTEQNGILMGDGTEVTGLLGTADGQVAKWDAASSTWMAGTDAIGSGGESSSGLEALDEGNGLGWRLKGREPDNYGPIGVEAVDLSYSTEEITSSYGALGRNSIAMGLTTRAFGMFSMAMGYYTKAEGRSSTALGTLTRAESRSSFAIGSNNIGGGDPENWVLTDPLFEIGNTDPSGAGRSNALTVLKNGNTGIGIAAPFAKLDVEGDIRSSDLSGVGQRNVMADANGNLVIGAGGGGGGSLWTENGDNIHYDAGNVGIGTNAPGYIAGAAQYLTVSPGAGIVADGDFGALEIRGRQQTLERPIGRVDFISTSSAGGNQGIARIQSRITDGATFRGDLSFHTMDGTSSETATLQERMTIKNDGKVGISDLSGTGQRNVMADTDGNLVIGTGGGGGTEAPSGLEAINGDIGIGWRLIGRDPNNYGPIGTDAVDLSTSITGSTIGGGATGARAIAMGRGTEASGATSIAMGFVTRASGDVSTTMGANTIASGDVSTAIGNNTRAQSYSSLAIGRHNIGGFTDVAGVDNDGDTNWIAEDPLFEIGNGSRFDNLHSALTVLKNGNVGIGEHKPVSLLEVAHENIQPTATDLTNALSIKNLKYDESWQLHAAHDLVLYKDGNLRGAFNSASGAYVQLSDRRMKKDITPLDNGTLQKVRQLNPVSYLMKDQKDARRNLGLISQEVQEIFPSLTNYVKDSDLLALSYTELIPILIKAIQEQQETIDNLKHKIDGQDNRYYALLGRLEVLERTHTFKKNSTVSAKN